MKSRLYILTIAAVAALTAVTTACSTNSMQNDGMISEQPPTYGVPDGSPVQQQQQPHMLRHTLRQIVEYDVTKMLYLVNHEINMKESDEEIFLNQAASVLSGTVMIQPHFTERETAIHELKGKLDQEDYIVVLSRAADQLIQIYQTSPYASDQAGALVALTNLVVEMKSSHRPELKSTMQKIASADLKVKDEARKYARESMDRLVSPSTEAQTALQTM
jgi:hypothetical protein